MPSMRYTKHVIFAVQLVKPTVILQYSLIYIHKNVYIIY